MELEEPITVRRVAYAISYRAMVLFSEATVLFAFVVSVVSSLIFQFDEVVDKDCGPATPNYLATISAVTGISPQRYLWRTCIALHSTPRIVMAVAYYNWHMAGANRLFSTRRLHSTSSERLNAEREQPSELDGDSSTCKCSQQSLGNWLWQVSRTRRFFELASRAAMVLNLIELASLMGISYISNRENYAVHEKLFEVFGISHLLYCYLTLWLIRRVHEPPAACARCCKPLVVGANQRCVYAHRHGLTWKASLKASYNFKCRLAVLELTLTIIMAIFFVSHTVYCVPYAFTCFAMAEYIATLLNMAFHYTAVYDLPGAALLIGVPTVHSETRLSNGYHHNTTCTRDVHCEPDPVETVRRRSAIGVGESEQQM